jgi:hypothetical protein
MLALFSGAPALRMSPPVMISGSEAVKAAAGIGRYSSLGSGAQQVGGVVPIPPSRPRQAEVQVGGVVPTNRPVQEEVTMPSKRKAMTPIGTFGAGLAERPKTADDKAIMVQGGSLRTWSYASPAVERVQVILSTEGRPLEADIELYQGPSNTPCKMRVYVEDGQARPFSAVIETPRSPNTVAIRNVGQMVFPFAANVIADTPAAGTPSIVDSPSAECTASFQTVQGGAIRTYPFDPSVDSVQVLLATDGGRPLNARVELIQGPNNNKQVIDLYTEDGLDRPFFCVLETPGPGNVVRIVNSGPMEFPIIASVVPDSFSQGGAFYDPDDSQAVIMGGTGSPW